MGIHSFRCSTHRTHKMRRNSNQSEKLRFTEKQNSNLKIWVQFLRMNFPNCFRSNSKWSPWIIHVNLNKFTQSNPNRNKIKNKKRNSVLVGMEPFYMYLQRQYKVIVYRSTFFSESNVGMSERRRQQKEEKQNKTNSFGRNVICALQIIQNHLHIVRSHKRVLIYFVMTFSTAHSSIINSRPAQLIHAARQS